MKFFNFPLLKSKKGAAALPVIILLGGIIVELGIAGSVLLFYLNNSLYGSLLASRALNAAQSGTNEAVRQIILKEGTSNPFVLTLDASSAEVDIARDCVTYGPDNCRVTITSVGKSLNREHTVETTLDVDSNTGEVDIIAVKEISPGP